MKVARWSNASVFDIARGVYRLRPLAAEPIDPARLTHRNPRERDAADLLATKDAVKITKENRIYGQGLQLTGKVTVAAEKREYRPQMLVDDEGRDDEVRRPEQRGEHRRAVATQGFHSSRLGLRGEPGHPRRRLMRASTPCPSTSPPSTSRPPTATRPAPAVWEW